MKRYCLTDCAKQKLSKAKERIIYTISAIAVTLAILLGITILLAVLGYCFEYLITIGWIPAPDNPFKSVLDAGLTALLFIFLTGIVSITIYFTASWLFNIFKTIGTGIVYRFDPNYKHDSCKLFEECKDN